jgi:signal transduction histidine kinase
MKSFSHPSTDSQAPADLNESIRNTLVVAHSEVKYVANVSLDCEDLPLVVCHVGDINQVMLNLIVNAAHAIAPITRRTQKKGRITIRTRCEGADAVVEVSDTGPGIPPEIAERVFEPFFTTKEVGVGTGQGLALAYSVIHDRHRGTIGFETDPVLGTTFTVRIPIAGVTA